MELDANFRLNITPDKLKELEENLPDDYLINRVDYYTLPERYYYIEVWNRRSSYLPAHKVIGMLQFLETYERASLV